MRSRAERANSAAWEKAAEAGAGSSCGDPDPVVRRLGAVQLFSPLGPGQKVHLVAGPFAQMLGILERMDDAGRVEVL